MCGEITSKSWGAAYNRVRLINGILPYYFSFRQTLCALIQGVFRKSSSDHGFDILDILMGFDAAEGQMQVGVATLRIHSLLILSIRIYLYFLNSLAK